jgi:hypothetical protein
LFFLDSIVPGNFVQIQVFHSMNIFLPRERQQPETQYKTTRPASVVAGIFLS